MYYSQNAIHVVADLTDIVESVPDTITKYEEVYPEIVKSHTHGKPLKLLPTFLIVFILNIDMSGTTDFF